MIRRIADPDRSTGRTPATASPEELRSELRAMLRSILYTPEAQRAIATVAADPSHQAHETLRRHVLQQLARTTTGKSRG